MTPNTLNPTPLTMSSADPEGFIPKEVHHATVGGIAKQCAIQRNRKMESMARERILSSTIIKIAVETGNIDLIKECVERIIEAQPMSINIHCNSACVGEKTIIRPYTNKRGEEHPAHFTIYGSYYGSCAKLGDEPVFYDGYFSYRNYKEYFTFQTPSCNKPASFEEFIVPCIQVPVASSAPAPTDDLMASALAEIGEPIASPKRHIVPLRTKLVRKAH
jgi:hypothetical protein